MVALWEVRYDPISDDYTQEEADADELLSHWTKIVEGKHPDGLIPIYWYVSGPGSGMFEGMPFQYPHISGSDDFLTHFHWPENVETGEHLNWLTLPVEDKQWNRKRATKGGFIQEATGWKPSILQPFVYLPSLLRSRR